MADSGGRCSNSSMRSSSGQGRAGSARRALGTHPDTWLWRESAVAVVRYAPY